MDALLQVSVDGFRLEESGPCCKPRNPQETGNDSFMCFRKPESQNPSFDNSAAGSDDFVVLKYINDMLMEEDLEGQSCMLQDSLALQAAERSFYEALHDQSSPSDQNSNDQSHDFAGNFTTPSGLHQPTLAFTDSPENADSAYILYGESQRRYRPRDDDDLENGRTIKQPAISSEIELSEKFEELLLSCTGNNQETSPNSQANHNHENRTRRAKGSSYRSLTQNPESVDLQSLLMQCAQAVASFDHRTATEKLKEIRSHSSRYGDGTRRLAFYFAEALESRIAGTQSPQLFSKLPSSRTSIVDILKGYKLPGGPPVLRITGIEMPQPGYRPSERVEETGRRLKRFCDKFNVPFEYNFIAKKWETISPDELVITKEETTVVNCVYRLRYVPDETVSMNSPRDIALKLFRDINPDLFVFAEVNGMYNSPFFVTRFREALFHFSSLFDIFEATTQEENEHRTLVEREIFVRDAMNVIACEGAERIERPETYKQWQVRASRARFRPVELNKEIMKEAKEMVRTGYHKDFVIDTDRHWMFQGWKGRVLYALSCWKPAEK
ncbi:PREDICTED: scarecrow-like protein 30 [Tarenaya hassleriana]|uniref:scarecrow-like protein 30 n=1 Tax=Tarenaya hassleriana TaxID=28532 RepID=UPI00053C8BF5|nr:PREDICTED: scarecrow-like protein 30 [Tarenaya hassleriana]